MRTPEEELAMNCSYARAVEFLRYLLSLGIICQTQANRANNYYVNFFGASILLSV